MAGDSWALARRDAVKHLPCENSTEAECLDESWPEGCFAQRPDPPFWVFLCIHFLWMPLLGLLLLLVTLSVVFFFIVAIPIMAGGIIYILVTVCDRNHFKRLIRIRPEKLNAS